MTDWWDEVDKSDSDLQTLMNPGYGAWQLAIVDLKHFLVCGNIVYTCMGLTPRVRRQVRKTVISSKRNCPDANSPRLFAFMRHPIGLEVSLAVRTRQRPTELLHSLQ
jgi:hypothetical protein